MFVDRSTAFVAVLALGLALVPAARVAGHEGHDHDAAPLAPMVSSAPRAEAVSDLLELVVVARGAVLELYLDAFRTNEPIEDAAIEVETADGPVRALATPGEPYRLSAAWVERPGRHDLVVSVAAGAVIDVLPVTLIIPEPAPGGSPGAQGSVLARLGGAVSGDGTIDIVMLGAGFLGGVLVMWLWARRRIAGLLAALCLVGCASTALAQPAAVPPAVARDQAQRQADGTVFVPKASQRILALRTIPVQSASHPQSMQLAGRIIADPNASGLVQAAVSGRLSAPPDGFPRLGAAVRAGDVLALVTPPFQAIDTSNIRQQASEIDQQTSLVERRLARLRSLRDVVPRTQVEETEIELRGLRERRASLDQVRREPERLLAPLDGVIAASNAAAGRIVETNSVVFHVIDPTRLWIEALHFEAVGEPRQASARLADGRVIPLAYRGTGLIGNGQAIPGHFAIEGDVAGLRIGQLVTVLVATVLAQQGVALPRGAVLRGSSGVDIVYEHSAAEQFRPREVRTVPLDGARVLVVAGVGPGLRIVAQGAELLNQIR